MSALLGGLGSSYVKPWPKEDTVKGGSTSSEDSPLEKVGNRQQDPHLGIVETPIVQENPQIHFESAGGNVREYLPTETQSEDYGLGKEAKFWKTYVKETDRWDGELVDEGLVLLGLWMFFWTPVFAALFSAIVTAFIVESSSLLQEDPADVSAQTLLIISQTLLAMSNNTQPIELTPTSPTPFAPSRSAVAVNVLWYLSLALSVSTAFLAILAKEWCHSFMIGRTGHPCLQARRRQRKWTMIERWKMRELILVLPSLIHLSLRKLLFAIGLCIYVWDLNSTVAIPVFCVCGLVVGFYIWSSLAASVLKSFPYTTMASRILRSGFVKPLHIFLRYGAATTLLLIYITAIIIMLCLIFLTICIPSCGYAIAGWVNPMLDWFQRLVDWLIDDDLDKQEEEPSQDIVASQAISWMITNCEVPRSVDVALQAIAGANKRLPREPLEECKAALVISRRLGSGDLYSRAGTRLVSLYIRALFVLGSNAESMDDSHKDELEIMIRDLQAGSKNQVTNLITDGTFVPNSQNLEALRIGSNAPHQCLILVNNPQNADPLPLAQVTRLLQNHIDDSKPLHPAALLSLVNAIAMLASCAPNKGVSNPALIIIHLLHSVLSTPPTTKTSLFEMSGILAVCALSQSRSVASPGVAQLNCLIRTEQSLRALADYMQGKTSSEIVFWSSVLELSSHPEAYGLDASSEPDSECLLPASGISYPETDLTSMISHLHVHATTAFSDIVDKLFSSAPVDRDLVEQYVQNIDGAYSVAQIQTPPTQVYVFLLECLCHSHMQDGIAEKCGQLLSRLSFPQLSLELVRYLRDHDIIPRLRDRIDRWPVGVRFLAASHLWLLFTLYLDTPDILPILREQMLLELEKYQPGHTEREQLEEARRDLARKIEGFWRWPHRVRRLTDDIGGFVFRFMECLFQQQKRPKSDPRWKQINQGLVGIPQELRGLSCLISTEIRKSDQAHVTLEVESSDRESKS
ncbi:hypothetical protein RHS04_08826 [Rhizoctonia solani]|uniref:DUF6535 domain-containing protein n=1 Tax=Rhizoctonia solani TaxID=456999 RepID=A0A8H7LG27_9AGAM|nr:hypothetical protein RHS04_08826 [Rhizoctonia solani]